MHNSYLPPLYHTFTSSTSLLFALVLSLSGCAKISNQETTLAETAVREAGCSTFEDEFWDKLYQFPIGGMSLPSPEKFAVALNASLATGRFANLESTRSSEIADQINELYSLIFYESQKTYGTNPTANTLEALSSIKIGDRTTPEKEQLQAQLRMHLNKISEQISVNRLESSCMPSPTPEPLDRTSINANQTSLLESWRRERHPLIYGALKSMATGYQSCEAGLMPAMNQLTSDVKGIKIVGKHINGVGNVRTISNVKELIQSHYYLSNYKTPSSNCFDVRSNPLIYDYGGKPFTTATSNSTLDFFKNAGSGSSVLGIDCSGFAYSAFAAAGLKLKRSGRLKAIDVNGVNARMYMNPQKNGLTCLDFVKFKADDQLRAGDVLASPGHMLFIESVGKDPFGISSITKEADCTTDKISVGRFDFTILQSSTSKGGIGINRIRGADYLSEGGPMKDGMIEHAVNACLAKLRRTEITSRSSTAQLVRHLATSNCFDLPIRLNREECVATCPAPF